MKKFVLFLIVLFAALSLVFVGCGGDDEEDDKKKDDGGGTTLEEIFAGTEDTDGAKIVLSGNTMTATYGGKGEFNVDLLTGENAFDASAYKGVKFEYKTTKQGNVGFQCRSDSNTMWLITDWGVCTVEGDWVEKECIFADDLIKAWGNAASFDKITIEKIFIGMGDGASTSDKFEIKNFAFIK
jgi:hypothetical protein